MWFTDIENKKQIRIMKLNLDRQKEKFGGPYKFKGGKDKEILKID